MSIFAEYKAGIISYAEFVSEGKRMKAEEDEYYRNLQEEEEEDDGET